MFLHCILSDVMMRRQTVRHQVRRLRTGDLAERSGTARTPVRLPSQMLHLQRLPQAVVDRRAALRRRRYADHLQGRLYRQQTPDVHRYTLTIRFAR